MGLDMWLERRPVQREEVGSWRKAYPIRDWFERRYGDAFRDNGSTLIDQEDLADLLVDCTRVLHDHTLAKELIPSYDGYDDGISRRRGKGVFGNTCLYGKGVLP